MLGILQKHATKLFLVIILVIAVFFRFYHFPNNPPSLNWDEVSIGYNAHSILLTGKDEFGIKFPLYFRSLDDYKQPVQVYLVAISEVVFGYNDFAVRFPSAFFGVLGVLFMYLLTYELTKKRWTSLIAALIFAILPWSVQFSRYSLEANTALTLLLMGVYLFIKSLNSKKWLMPISMILFLFASYTYLSYKVIVPLTVFGIFIIFRKSFNFKSKIFALTAILFIVVCVLITRDFLSPTGQVRLNGTSALNNTSVFQKETAEIVYEGSLKINLPRRIFHEIPGLTNAGIVAKGYLSHFSPNFLFFDTGQKYHFAPNIGLIYIWMIPFIFFGAFKLFNKKGNENYVLLWLLVIAPIPASVTYDVPHAIRVFLLCVPLTIFSAIGIEEIYMELSKRKKIFAVIFVAGILFAGFMYSWQFFRQYMINLPHERSQAWQYGRREMTQYLFSHQKDYKRIIVSTTLEWPRAFMLYYGKYDPAKYLAQGGTISGSWAEEGNHFDNFYFHKFQNTSGVYAKDVFADNTLLVGAPTEFPNQITPVKIINYLDGKPAIYMVKAEDIRNFIPH